jgi:hypothetical protein
LVWLVQAEVKETRGATRVPEVDSSNLARAENAVAKGACVNITQLVISSK